MDYAREINPNFYILGELFTNNETIDHKFINELGINALVRGEKEKFFSKMKTTIVSVAL
jgi:hypothetical protein